MSLYDVGTYVLITEVSTSFDLLLTSKGDAGILMKNSDGLAWSSNQTPRRMESML